MREILFRGKRVDNGAWETGSLVIVRMDLHDAQYFIADKMTGYHTPVEKSTIGQYTGHTDKNGKRIFEGDILKSHYDFLFPDDVTFDLVVFCDSAWCIQQNGFEPEPLSADIISELSEVVGNIHDNPELLEGNRS